MDCLPDGSESQSNAQNSQPTTVVEVNVITQQAKSESADAVALKALFQTALETRNFEITQLVQRNNFFMIFQGVLLGSLVQSSHSKAVVSFLVCVAGFAVSIYQVQMAAGAKFWQEYWEAAVNRIEEELLSHLEQRGHGRSKLLYLFHDDNCIYEKMVKDRLIPGGRCITNRLIMRRFSVSRIPIYVSIVLTIIWGLLLLCTLRAYPPLSTPSFIVGF